MATVLKILLIILLIYIIYKYYYSTKLSFSNTTVARQPVIKKKPKTISSWSDHLIYEELTQDDLKRHYNDMVRQAPIFSSGASFTEVEEDNTSPAMTGFYGLNRPSYVPVLPGQRQVTDLDINQFKKNKYIRWN